MGMLHSELMLALESRLLTEPRINGQIRSLIPLVYSILNAPFRYNPFIANNSTSNDE